MASLDVLQQAATAPSSNFIGHSEASLSSLQLDEDRYIHLLSKLIGESEHLQNNPAQGLIPQEDLAVNHILEILNPVSTKFGGPLVIEKLSYVENRSNLLITYPGTSDEKTVSFVGSHMDVVPANPETWDRYPFELTREGDRLYGRGTTDCLGHVALLTEFMHALAELRPTLQRSVTVLLIANEENALIDGVGVDAVHKAGKMDGMKRGPLFWIDSADSHPCIGTAGVVQWSLKGIGKLFHSGLPHKGINPIEMLMEAFNIIQRRFYEDFARVPDEEKWNFSTASTMKPTQFETARGSLNQIPPHATISGDIRLTPFYSMADCMATVEKYVEEINNDIGSLPTRGNYSKFELPDEDLKGKLILTWLTEGENGIACNLDSEGHIILKEATQEVLGDAQPFAINGTLPLVRWLQDNGFDVQIAGYGLSSAYHADNEYVELPHMKKAFRILAKTISKLEEKI
mmetsp:Transcript_24142/g.31531  ORF Transcript_24142/g.31531 Transcript_24142/m.31531 type:complete len:459 (-) Transcript_24142:295-1671(-)